MRGLPIGTILVSKPKSFIFSKTRVCKLCGTTGGDYFYQRSKAGRIIAKEDICRPCYNDRKRNYKSKRRGDK